MTPNRQREILIELEEHNMYEVIVSNLGAVVKTHDLNHAQETYEAYCSLSSLGWGKVGGENVTLLGDRVLREYDGHNPTDS